MGYVSGELTSAVNPPRVMALRAEERSGEGVSTHRGAQPPEGRVTNSVSSPAAFKSAHSCSARLAAQLALLVDFLELAINLSP